MVLLFLCVIFSGYVETFKYTTHPWLLKMYLDCPENFTMSGVTLKVTTTIIILYPSMLMS